VKRVLLIGAGHGHLVVLRSLAQRPLYGARIMLVTPRTRQTYSGMLPGILAGHYRRAEGEIDIAALAGRAYVELEHAEVDSLDLGARDAVLTGGRRLGYDIASLNVGSQVTPLPGAEHALALKPYDDFLDSLHMIARIAIIGGGAAGAEVAMALRHRGAQVTVYSAHGDLGPRVMKQLRSRGVDYRPGMAATAIERGPVVIAGTARQAFDLVLLATGAAPHPWLARSRLAKDERGFVLVDGALRSVSHPEVFALGDCATLREAPHPKSGVYAVRHGEALSENLRRLFAGAPLARYAPQKNALLILTCGARYAIAQRGARGAQGRWVWWWKNRIDRRWIRSFS
jgi:pyridine nucleotide-disulfide oxidoreductase family protein